MSNEYFAQAPYQTECDARVVALDGHGVILDGTVCYATGGGQPGDTGTLTLADGQRATIVDTRRQPGTRAIMHLLAPDAALPAIGDAVKVEIDWARRYRHMRMHTALHLLSAVVPLGVTGGNLTDERGRLDFDATDAALARDDIEARLNALVTANLPVRMRVVDGAELDAHPELIKTMSVKPPAGLPTVRLIEIEDTDLQPCGGTHVAHTGEIGRLVVTKIESKGARNRRIVLGFADSQG